MRSPVVGRARLVEIKSCIYCDLRKECPGQECPETVHETDVGKRTGETMTKRGSQPFVERANFTANYLQTYFRKRFERNTCSNVAVAIVDMKVKKASR